jgi:hypothetical protein
VGAPAADTTDQKFSAGFRSCLIGGGGPGVRPDGVAGGGLPLLVCFLRPGLVVSIAVFVVAGAFGTATYMQSTATVVRGFPDSRRAQLLGMMYAGMMATQGLSPFVDGMVADRVGAADAVGWFGVIGLMVAVPVALAWRRAMTSSPEVWLPSAEAGARSVAR